MMPKYIKLWFMSRGTSEETMRSVQESLMCKCRAMVNDALSMQIHLCFFNAASHDACIDDANIMMLIPS